MSKGIGICPQGFYVQCIPSLKKMYLCMLNIVVKYNVEEFGANACFNSLPQIAYFTLTTNDPIIQELCDWSPNLHREKQMFLFLIYLSKAFTMRLKASCG